MCLRRVQLKVNAFIAKEVEEIKEENIVYLVSRVMPEAKWNQDKIKEIINGHTAY